MGAGPLPPAELAKPRQRDPEPGAPNLMQIAHSPKMQVPWPVKLVGTTEVPGEIDVTISQLLEKVTHPG